jgi:hypothetical protein
MVAGAGITGLRSSFLSTLCVFMAGRIWMMGWGWDDKTVLMTGFADLTWRMGKKRMNSG